jgi:UDP-glucuronate 4-epimerase
MKVLVTGTAGFIGFHVVKQLCAKGYNVIGLDNINDYYDTSLKYARLATTGIPQDKIEYNCIVASSLLTNYSFIKLNLEDKNSLENIFEKEKFDYIVHLAAQAGVRYSLENPAAYINSNIIGFTNILECCRHNNVKHLVYASSSSVYGLNENYPFRVTDGCNHPVSLYAATKKSNELMAHTYSHLFNIPTTGLRFFTVYGPWGRPDMSPMLFAHAIANNKPIKIFNNGKMKRDFTFVDDIVDGVIKVMEKPAWPSAAWNPQTPSPSESSAPYRIYNIGNSCPVNLLDYIVTIEKAMNKEAIKEFLPMQPGDVVNTYSDVSELVRDFGYAPSTPLEKGIQMFIDWYKSYYHNINLK